MFQPSVLPNNGSRPGFFAHGPDAERYGAAEGYPIADPTRKRQPGVPNHAKYRIGAYSHYDEIFPTRRVRRSVSPWIFNRSAADIGYSHEGKRSSIAEYLPRKPATGLIIVKDDQIICENYQYARSDRDRFRSQSTAKTITAMLIGIAVSKSRINSVDDTADTYVVWRGSRIQNTAGRQSAICRICLPASISAKPKTAAAISTDYGST